MSAPDSTSPLDALLAQAIAHHQAGRLESAQRDYDQILEQQPEHALVLHNRGLLLSQQGRHVEGVADLRRAVQLAPDEGEFWLSLARGLVQAGAPDEALDIVEHVHQRGYNSPSADQVRTQATAALTAEPPAAVKQTIIDLYNAGQLAEMEQATRALLARRPQSAFGWSVLGTALQSQGQSPREALLRLLELAPHDAEAHTHFGDDLQNSGQFEESLSSYLRAIELAPRYAPAHCNLGSALEALGRSADAQESYRRAIAADPGNLSAHFNLGNSLRDAERYDEAVESYRAALALAPADPQLLTYLADTLRAQQQYDQALPLYREVVALLPEEGEAWANLGTALQQAGELAPAVEAQLRALELDSGLNALHANLALALHALQRHDEAEQHYLAALALEPDNAGLHSGLADLLCKRGAYADSVNACQAAIALAPGEANAYFILASAQQCLNDYAAALHSYDQLLALQPEHAEAWLNKAIALQQMGEYLSAVEHYERGLALRPDSASGYANMGVSLQRLGRIDDARAAQHQALALAPELALAHTNLAALHYAEQDYAGAVRHAELALASRPDFLPARRNLIASLQILERHAEALEHCRLALADHPEQAELYFDLGNSQRELHDPDAAMQSYEQALALQPGYTDVLTNMIPLLLNEGRPEDAVTTARAALAQAPDSAMLHSNLLFLLSHIYTDAEALFEEHCRFGDQFEAALRDGWQRHPNNTDPDRRLRVGFVSGDFNVHALASFFEPVAILLAREPSLELYAFYNKTQEDSMTARLKSVFAHWHNITGLGDDAAEQLLRQLEIDILIDLSGHSAENRLPLFARRPAPVQATWLGYAGTTGLLGIDYYLSDHLRMPEGRYDNQFTEHVVRMPLCTPFLPEAYSPPIHPLPALSNGYLTFGTFSRANKLSREVIALWARVLQALPTSRMLLGGLGSGRVADTVLSWFAAEGVAAERLDVRPRGNMRDYLQLHREIDVLLNPFPYTGATTLLHGLWMGVPTLTMTGPTVPSHGSAAFLEHLGLDAFVTADADLFVQRAVFLSENIPPLAAMRISMRDRYNASLVGKPEVAAAGMERAMRIMWQRWCAGISPGPIRVALEDIAPAAESELGTPGAAG